MSTTAKQSVTFIVAIFVAIGMGYLVWSFSVTTMQATEANYPFDSVHRGLTNAAITIRRPAAHGTERIDFNGAIR
jgi:hypothetical protein